MEHSSHQKKGKLLDSSKLLQILGEDYNSNKITNTMTDQQIEQTARAAHEVNRAYCISIGDFSQPSWEDAPEWQKSSAIDGVKFHLAEPRTPQESHESWLKQKREEGWKYGPVKDAEKKEHPCFIEYERLPAEQRTKDFLFKAVIESAQKITEDSRLTVGQKIDLTIDHISQLPPLKSTAVAITHLQTAKFWFESNL